MPAILTSVLASQDASYTIRRSDLCAKLTTVREGRKEAIILSLTRPAIIGRDPEHCSYVVNDSLISAVHCKIYAVRSPSGGVMVSCLDLSRNGIFLNGHHIRKTAIILMDGDILELPNLLAFTCVHLWKETKEKLTIFDPTPPLLPAQKVIGEYTVTSQCLGSGSFATVHLALDPARHRQVACKSIRTRKDYDVDQVMKEVRILMTLKHPNINEIYGTVKDQKFIHIFLQLCTGGDLFSYITSPGVGLCEAEAKYIMYQMLKGLNYLHQKMISHRDLKPENILLYSPGPYPWIVVADFGLARPNAYQETFNVCGTVSYLPPEGILALDNKHLTYTGMPADCWSAGVILYIMFCGFHPFDNEPAAACNSSIISADESGEEDSFQNSQDYVQKEGRLKQRIVHGEVQFERYPWQNLPDAKFVVSQLLIHDYRLRATVPSILQSNWFTSELKYLEDLYRRRMVN